MPVLTLLPRDASAKPQPVNPIYIAGFCIVGAIVLGLVVWFGLRFHRKRAAAKREEARGAAFLSVRGLVKENGEDSEKGHFGAPQAQGGAFSRELLDSSVVLPDKVLVRPQRTNEDVINFHRESGTFPQPFALKPFSFALSAGVSSPTLSPDSANRQSFMSGSTNKSRFSVMSTNSSMASNSTGHARKVRQLFDPVLPDELLLARVGEQLTIVQSFDDGWCLAGRENGTFASTAKSLFKPNVAPDSEVELGVVPAWCFIKPVLGLRAERPVRSTSLGITVQMSAPGFSSRDEITSWSNF